MLRRTHTYAALLVVVFLGCLDKKEEMPSDDPDALAMRQLVQSMRDKATRSEQEFANMFVDGDGPIEHLEKFQRMIFSVLATPRVNGNTAVLKIEVIDDRDVAHEMNWEFEKTMGSWKIKNAPLPADATSP